MIANSCKSPVSGYAVNIKDNYLVIKNDFRELEKRERKHKKRITITNILECLDKNKDAFFKIKMETIFETIINTSCLQNNMLTIEIIGITTSTKLIIRVTLDGISYPK